MRTNQERRIRHVAQLKARKSVMPLEKKATSSADKVVSDRVKGKTYKEMKIDGQKFYLELITSKD